MATIPLPEGYAWRRVAPTDLPLVQELLDTCEAADTGETRAHQLDVVAEGRQPRVDIERDYLLIVSSDGALAAFGWLFHFESGNCICEPNVHPEHRAAALEGPLLTALESRASDLGHGHEADPSRRLDVWCESVRGDRRAMLGARGYAKVRDFLIMRIELAQGFASPVLPSGLTVRSFRPGVDERALHKATEEAFAEHFHFEPSTFDEFCGTLAARKVNPDLWLVAWDGDEVAGEVLSLERAGDVYVESVSVRKPWRGRGLALALLLNAFARLHARGHDAVFLGLDAENATGALQLYQKAGMRVWRRFEMFEKRLL
ncbi:MAG: N-acetyltransferase family protein [Gaiellaceae bacterium]